MPRSAPWLLAPALLALACSANREGTTGAPDVVTAPEAEAEAGAAPAADADANAGTGTDADAGTAADAGPAADADTDAGADAGAARHVYRVAAIGDSLTDDRSHGGKFLDMLRKRCPESQFDNHGKGGNMVNQMRRRFGAVVDKEPPYTHVIVFGGVNDLYSDKTAFRTVPKIQADLSAMYAAARQRGMRVVALTVAPWGGFKQYYNASRGATTRQLNEWIRGRPAAGEVDHVVDAYALLSCGNPERICPELAKPFLDGIHFGPKGHEVLGRALFDAVFSDCR